MSVNEISEIIEELQERAKRLSSGEELCDHHWNGSDGCYECYCTGCDKHIAEIRDETGIPFKSDAYCYECRKTPEEKEAEKKEEEDAIRKSELKQLSELNAKYPDFLKAELEREE